MSSSIKTKTTFGGCNVNHFSPPFPETAKKAVNVILSFEDTLKLHLSLGQLLAKLNGYNRNTTEGRKSAANICIYTYGHRITVNEAKLKR